MKKSRKFFTVLTCLTAVLLCANIVMAGGEIKLALDCPQDVEKCATYLWSKTFSDYLVSQGLKVKLYPKDALGGEAEKLDQVRQGLLEISNSDLSKAGSLDPTIFGFYLPFLFQDMGHVFKTMEKTDLLGTINAGITPHGVRVLAIVPVGDMSGFLTTKKLIKSPSDFKGVRMRALDKKQAKWLETWGANAVVIPWPEIYNALQTGVADGYLNSAFVPLLFKHTEVLKYFSDVKMAPALRVVICSEDWYKNLSGNDRIAVDAGVVQANTAIVDWTKTVEKQSLDALKNAGMTVYVNTPAEKAQFAELIRPIYTDIVSEKIVNIFTEAAAKGK